MLTHECNRTFKTSDSFWTKLGFPVFLPRSELLSEAHPELKVGSSHAWRKHTAPWARLAATPGPHQCCRWHEVGTEEPLPSFPG